MKDHIGIGIIGTGFARKVQIPGFRACTGVRIASVASARLEKAKSTADECGAGHFTDDWRETVEHPDVDIVCITTPPKLHREMTLAAVANGKHILCEKPMAMNVAEAQDMADAVRGKPLLALIDHELRFQDGRRRAYQMLRDGAIGKVRHAKAMFQAPHRGDPSIAWDWWSDAEQGGGALGAIVSHIIDSMHWFLGADISHVTAQLQSHAKSRVDAGGTAREVTSDDETMMLLRFADGDITSDATGMVSVSMVEGPGYLHRMEFYGTGGTMRIDHLGELSIAKTGGDWDAVDVDLGTPIPGIPDTGFARAFMAIAPVIVDAIRNGQTSIEHAATFEDGLRVQHVLDAARQSDAEGIRVKI